MFRRLLYRLWVIPDPPYYRYKPTTSSRRRGYSTLSPNRVSRYFLTGLFDTRPGRVIPCHPTSSRLRARLDNVVRAAHVLKDFLIFSNHVVVSTDDLHYEFETWFLSQYQESYPEELENSSKIPSFAHARKRRPARIEPADARLDLRIVLEFYGQC